MRVNGRVSVIGDVHGQFYDLYGILKKLHKPESPNDNLLFLGDYVDRGAYGPEIVLLLLALKIRYPKNVNLLRGNHESREMTESFNFREQCLDIYDAEFYDKVMEIFQLLPVAAIVNGTFLCMHGGMSKFLTDIEAINNIDRKMEPPEEDCLLSDILWADPAKSRYNHIDFTENSKRCVSFVFGKRPVNRLLEKEGLKAIVRAHECKQDGFKMHLWNGEEEFPPVITVFSAPNYCGTHENRAGVIITEGDDIDV